MTERRHVPGTRDSAGRNQAIPAIAYLAGRPVLIAGTAFNATSSSSASKFPRAAPWTPTRRYCCRSAGIGIGTEYALAPVPTPFWQELGGVVQMLRVPWHSAAQNM